jgi:RNA polymerase sigma-70 factor (ECF subfamily)
MVLNLFNTIRKRSDEELMGRICADGDERAFNELYRRHARRLQGFFFRMLGGNNDLAADFVQEVFLRLWSARTKYREGDCFSTWMFSMAYNLCKNEYRRQSRRIIESVEEEGQMMEQTYEEDFELQMDVDTLDRLLHEELQQLPPSSRLLFALRYEEELTVPQIAEIISVPEGTVKSRLNRMMGHLRQRLTNYVK